MRIDLRYPIVVGAFFVPGIFMLIGGFGLGFSLNEIRDIVAFMGGIMGGFAVIFASHLFIDGNPIWFTIGRKGGDQ